MGIGRTDLTERPACTGAYEETLGPPNPMPVGDPGTDGTAHAAAFIRIGMRRDPKAPL